MVCLRKEIIHYHEVSKLLACHAEDSELACHAVIYESLVETAMAVTGQSRDCAGKTTRRLLEDHPEVRTKCPNFKFPGQGSRETPVGPPSVIIEFVMLLPGRAAALCREKFACIIATCCFSYTGSCSCGWRDRLRDLADSTAEL